MTANFQVRSKYPPITVLYTLKQAHEAALDSGDGITKFLGPKWLSKGLKWLWLRTDVTEDRTDQGPKWICTSVLGPKWLRTKVDVDRYNQPETCLTYGNSKLRGTSIILYINIAIYVSHYAISGPLLWYIGPAAAMYQGRYTLWVKKKLCHFYFYCNFGKCWSIFKILSISESERKWLITSMKNFPLLLNFVATLPCKTNTSVNVRVKLWRFCVEKHQTSFLQICGLHTVQISIQLITRSVMSCSVVYTRGKSTPSTNWSRGWLKFGAGLNSRLSTWLLVSGAKDLIRACVRAKGGH